MNVPGPATTSLPPPLIRHSWLAPPPSAFSNSPSPLGAKSSLQHLCHILAVTNPGCALCTYSNGFPARSSKGPFGSPFTATSNVPRGHSLTPPLTTPAKPPIYQHYPASPWASLRIPSPPVQRGQHPGRPACSNPAARLFPALATHTPASGLCACCLRPPCWAWKAPHWGVLLSLRRASSAQHTLLPFRCRSRARALLCSLLYLVLQHCLTQSRQRAAL